MSDNDGDMSQTSRSAWDSAWMRTFTNLLGIIIAAVAATSYLHSLISEQNREMTALRRDMTAQISEQNRDMTGQISEQSREMTALRRDLTMQISEQNREIAALRCEMIQGFALTKQEILSVRSDFCGRINSVKDELSNRVTAIDKDLAVVKAVLTDKRIPASTRRNKSCGVEACQSLGVERSEMPPYYNIGAFPIAQPRELSHSFHPARLIASGTREQIGPSFSEREGKILAVVTENEESKTIDRDVPPWTSDQEAWMQLVYNEVEVAIKEKNAPFAAIILDENNRLLAKAHNQVNTQKLATAHAEIEAIKIASVAHGGKKLHGCTIYTNAEPCGMCATALIKAGITRIFYGAPHEEGSNPDFHLLDVSKKTSSKIEIHGGITAERFAEQIQRGRKSMDLLP